MEIAESHAVGKKTLSLLLKPKEEQEDFRYRMIEANAIEHLLPVQKLYESGQVRYLYDTTEKRSLADLAARHHFGEKIVRQLVTQLLNALLMGSEYYLEEDSYLLTPEYIYLNAMETSYSFCYCPDYQEEIRGQVSGLIEFLMNKVDYEDLAAVKLVYGLYQLVKEEGFSARRLLGYVENYHYSKEVCEDKPSIVTSTPELLHTMYEESQIMEQVVPIPQILECQEKQPIPMPSIEPPRPEAYQPGQDTIQVQPTKEPQKGTIVVVLSVVGFIILFSAGYAAGIFYTEIGRQIDLTKIAVFAVLVCMVEGYIAWRMFGCEKEPQKQNYRLVPCGGTLGGTVMIEQFPFVIGKNEKQVHLVLKDAKVSRIHATINIQKDVLYVMDASSLNGTYVNQTKLPPNSNQRIKIGDYISFANQVYQLSA